MQCQLTRLCQIKRIAMLVTLEELAGASGFSAAELCRIETGESAPNADYLAGMAAALGIRAMLPGNSLPPEPEHPRASM
jgi:transcriptional regulator with XRE-family HTH domain